MEHDEILKRIEKAEDNIASLFKKYNEVNNQNGIMEVKLDFILETVKDLKTELSKIVEQPSKRWESIKTSAIVAVVTSLVTAGMALILIK